MVEPLPLPPPPGFDELTPEEKIRYVGALWDRIVDNESMLPAADAQRELVRERLAAHQAAPDAAQPWGDVRREIEAKLREQTRR